MNARERAIEEAMRYWRACGLPVDEFALEARQAPLHGSVWWVEAHAAGARHDLLVYRLGKARFRCQQHRPHGYTIYACRKGGETPLAVVEYEAQAREAIARLQQSPLYAQVTLCSVPNSSAAWAEAISAFLAEKQQGKEKRRRRKAENLEGIAQLLLSRVIEQVHAGSVEGEDSAREPYPQEIFKQLDAAIRAKSPYYFVHHREATQAFLAKRMRQGTCQPFGWVWTDSECLWLSPGDAISQQSLFASQRWKRKKYLFYFDGQALLECATHAELSQLLGFDC